MSENYRRLDYLDSLRGFAACSVVLYHMVMLPGLEDIPSWLKIIAHFGETGVPLFFVVSAFSLFYALDAQRDASHPFLRFYVRRFFRIAPLFYFLVAFLVVGFWPSWPSLSSWILPNVLFYFNFIAERQESIVPAGWTIGVEVLFYLIFPLVFRLANTLVKSVTFLVLTWTMCVAAWYVVPFFVSNPAAFFDLFIFRHLPIFACGVVAYQAVRLLGPAVRPLVGPAAMLIFVVIFSAHRAGAFGAYYHYTLGPIFAVLIVALSAWSPSLLVNNVTKFLGKISYSIYLTHAVVITATLPAYKAIYATPIDPSLKFLSITAMTFGIVIPLSWLTFTFIEDPANRFGKWLSNQDRAKNVRDPAAVAAE